MLFDISVLPIGVYNAIVGYLWPNADSLARQVVAHFVPIAKIVPATTGPKPVKLGSSCQCNSYSVFVSCKPEGNCDAKSDGGNLVRFRSHDVRDGDRHVPCDVR